MQTIRTPEKEAAILDALKARPTWRYAARRAKVSKTALIDWRRDDPAFAARCEEARKAGFGEVEDELVDRALSGDTTALIFLTKSHFRETYGDRIDHRHGGTITLDAGWATLRAAILSALVAHPEALESVRSALKALEAGE